MGQGAGGDSREHWKKDGDEGLRGAEKPALGTTKGGWPRLVLVFPPDSDNPPRALCVRQTHTE